MNLSVVGVSVWGLVDGTSLLVGPGGEEFRVGAPAQEVAGLLARCDGSAGVAELAADSEEPEGVRGLLEALLDAGCLTTDPPVEGARWWARFPDAAATPDRVGAAELVVVGDAPVADPLAAALAAAGTAAAERTAGEGLAGRLAAGPAALVVCALAAADHGRLLAVQDACAAAGVAWAAFVVDRGSGWLGPLVVPGRTADYRDLIDRRRCLVDDPELWPAHTAPPVWPAPELPPAAELTWMVSAMAVELTRWLAGAPCRLLSTEVEADPVTLTLTDHPILPVPVPGRPGHPVETSWTPTPDHLVDPRTGVILRIHEATKHPTVPDALTILQGPVTDMARLGTHPWHNFTKAWCSTFDSPEEARAALIGEAVERYCANNTMACGPSELVSYDELVAGGEGAVDPESLVLYSPRQHAQPGFPFVPFTRDLPVRWVKGRNLTRDTDAWLPAGLVYINWHLVDSGEEPVLGFHNYAGVAAGPSVEFAVVSAIEEVVERDAMMTWWSNRHALPAVRLTGDLAALWAGRPAELGQHAWAIHLDNQFGIPVVAGIVENTVEQFLTLGFAARPDPRDATRKAWGEAEGFQLGLRDMNAPEESLNRELLAARGHPLQPYREDRRYLDAVGDDFHDLITTSGQLQIHLDPRARKRVSPWIDVPTTRGYDELPRLPDRTLATYRERVERHGYEIYTAELTTPDIALCGLHVVRVLIPGLAPNFPAAFPTWGRGRIQQHAVTLGWRTDPLPEDQLNTFPLPYA